MRILDISPLVHPGLAVWPGDVPFERTVACSMAAGANLDLSSIRTTVHVGAHADAPSHYADGAPGIDARPLELYLGPCQVIAVDVPRGARVRPEDVRAPIVAPRVLFRTGTFPDPDAWNADFASLSPELVAWLHERGVRLVGLDTPSVDPQDDRLLESHTAIAARDMAILEGVVLDHVPPGVYTLIALPLKLAGADASPVRAVLVDDLGSAP
jgi:arylformamidase